MSRCPHCPALLFQIIPVSVNIPVNIPVNTIEDFYNSIVTNQETSGLLQKTLGELKTIELDNSQTSAYIKSCKSVECFCGILLCVFVIIQCVYSL